MAFLALLNSFAFFSILHCTGVGQYGGSVYGLHSAVQRRPARDEYFGPSYQSGAEAVDGGVQ